MSVLQHVRDAKNADSISSMNLNTGSQSKKYSSPLLSVENRMWTFLFKKN